MGAYVRRVLGRCSRAGHPRGPLFDPILEEHVRSYQPYPSRSPYSHSGLMERPYPGERRNHINSRVQGLEGHIHLAFFAVD
jgi:hypothetical protein